jgi:glycosyltransferase involved in cell wall biosynthesis
VFNLLFQLGRVFDVTLIALGTATSSDVQTLKDRTGVGEVVVLPHSKLKAFFGVLLALISGKPLQVGYYQSRSMAYEVRRRLINTDICVFHLIRTSIAWPGKCFSRVPAVIEMCDAISENFAQTASEGAKWSPWTWISAIEAPRTTRFELYEIMRFDLVSMHTGKDASHLGVPPTKLLISTQGVDLNGMTYVSPTMRSGKYVVMVGRMDFFPNWSGAEWFAKNVLPLLPKDIWFKVVGDTSLKIKTRLEETDRVLVTGKVDSISSACIDAFAAVAPMQVATGIQNKALEYFAMGLPAILSPSVASGLLPTALGGFRVANSPAEWAQSVVEIFERPDLAANQTEIARKYVMTEHDWDRIGDAYNQRLLNLIKASK